MASVALPAADTAASGAGRRPLPRVRRVPASVSSHSRAPSSRVHGAAGFGRAPPRRRSRSSSASPPRSSAARRDTSWAPRRATLPHPAVLRGSGGRAGRSSRPLASLGRRRGGADLGPAAPALLLDGPAPLVAGRPSSLPHCGPHPSRTTRCRSFPGYRLPHYCHSAGRSSPGPAALGRPAGSAFSASGSAPEAWPRRSPPAAAPPRDRDGAGLPAPALRPLAAPPGRAGRAERAGRAGTPTHRTRRLGAAIRLGGVLGHRVILRASRRAVPGRLV